MVNERGKRYSKEEFLNLFERSIRSALIRDDDVILFVNSTKQLKCQDCSPYEYIDVLLSNVGNGVTVVMQAFNWGFCKGKKYHYAYTCSETGIISEAFRRMDGVVRSPHPIYSVCAKGKKAELICQHDGRTCWGSNTPFEKLVEEDSLIMNFGKKFPWGITLLHRFEEVKQVPYRFFKTFKGVADFGEGEMNYRTEMYVRDLEKNKKYQWQSAVDVLLRRNQVKGINLDFELPMVRAKDLERACYECLDKDVNIFLEKRSPENIPSDQVEKKNEKTS
jgi:aminoglycoside 3-N-acetyltransferase